MAADNKMAYLDEFGTSVLIDQLKQYVKNAKQIFAFTTKNAFPNPGKVGNVYLDTTTHTIWLYDIDAGYYQFTEDYLRDNDNILINCGRSDDMIIDHI